jgi:RNAse (barnase) inhibitor barstar
MTPYALLTTLDAPALFVVSESEDAFANLALGVAIRDPSAVVRTVRGRKSRTVATFFDEIAAALQFPYYFGENWNALNDVLSDLEWLPGSAYLILIADADQLLADADDEFQILMQIFTRTRIEWLTPNQYMPRDRQPTPCHVLLQVADQERVTRLSERLSRAEATFDILVDSTPAP